MIKTLMIKTLLLICLFPLGLSALAAPAPAIPTPAVPSVSALPPTLSGVLDREIGTGHILKITLKSVGDKPAEILLATVQGRTDTQFFISQVHFRIYAYSSGRGIMPEGAPASIYIQMDQMLGGGGFPTYPLTDTAAITMLETDPRHFVLGKTYATYEASKPLLPSAVAGLEWLHVPSSALPFSPLPVQARKPMRVNPSLSALWP